MERVVYIRVTMWDCGMSAGIDTCPQRGRDGKVYRVTSCTFISSSPLKLTL